ncbi:MAG: hypothetical protein P1U61_08975 [Legionellaceae bacterium]|nr:hypothetical protein [Legionellaceae bacterium]
MHKKSLWIITSFILFFSLSVDAKTCSHTIDCNGWEAGHCACGVHARCHGVTQQKVTGKCRCVGAEGVCNSSSSSSIRIRGANRIRRVAPPREDAKDTRIQTTD